VPETNTEKYFFNNLLPSRLVVAQSHPTTTARRLFSPEESMIEKFDTLTDDELLQHVYMNHSANELVQALAKRLEAAQDEILNLKSELMSNVS
jgi:hypothetical protein